MGGPGCARSAFSGAAGNVSDFRGFVLTNARGQHVPDASFRRPERAMKLLPLALGVAVSSVAGEIAASHAICGETCPGDRYGRAWVYVLVSAAGVGRRSVGQFEDSWMRSSRPAADMGGA